MNNDDRFLQDFRFARFTLHDIKNSLSTLNFLLAWIAVELTIITAAQVGLFE